MNLAGLRDASNPLADDGMQSPVRPARMFVVRILCQKKNNIKCWILCCNPADSCSVVESSAGV